MRSDTKPLALVYCLVYNHEKYLERTLGGFVMQQTEYPFQVIVHDDASTDSSAQIIRDYAERYPGLFHVICQQENQYSRSIPIYRTHIEPLLTSTYTAICEGDDYWLDEQKLQKQISYMQAHPNCALCVHNTAIVNEDGSETGRFANQEHEEDTDYTTADIIRAKGGGLFHTSSYLYRTQYRKEMPHDFRIKRIGDYPLAIWLSLCGEVHYLHDTMSAYRQMSAGSYTAMQVKSRQLRIEAADNMIAGLCRMDDYTHRQFHREFREVLDYYRLRRIKLEENKLKYLLYPQYWWRLLR